MSECARLRLENQILRSALEKAAKDLAEERKENEYLRGVIGEAIEKLEVIRKKRFIFEIEV